ncbi:glycoside hydrolase [Exidia glandulosa HHB12029]|uniref:Glycoside hydrolase n=1 Tax=Exidia glandulosa HHB12029 TaxID=1314781 RepID=A0A165QTP0_EXIGL|nr:glycoside hydrolase [Exidia glandulosa HHB12029]
MLTIFLALPSILVAANAGPVPDPTSLIRDRVDLKPRDLRSPAHAHRARESREPRAHVFPRKSHELAFETVNNTLDVVGKKEEKALENERHLGGSVILVPPSKATSHGANATDASPSSPAPIIAAYYPDWGSAVLSPEDVDFDRFDWIDFAFAIPNADFGLDFDSAQSKVLLTRLVTAAHAKKKFVKLSVGGWTGSAHFSQAVGDEKSRNTFIKNIAAAYSQYNLDGIDIDWEYPGVMGESGNSVSPHDTDNFLTFLRDLRAKLPSSARISAACQVWPFADEAGNPKSDISVFASVLDWILLMNYDANGSSSTPGSNAPLDDGCHNSTQPFATARAAVATWTKAGFPASQIILGIPSYGYISQSSATYLHNKRDQDERGQVAFDEKSHDIELKPPNKSQTGVQAQDASSSTKSLEVENEDGGVGDGQVQFRSLVQQGALKLSSSGKYVGARGYRRTWDQCSSTPFLRSQTANQVITYDDPESLKLKAAFAKEAGLLGVNMFDAHGDTKTWDLIDAARAGFGLKQA